MFLGAAGDGVFRATLPFKPASAELDPRFTLPDIDWSDNRTSRWPRFQTMLDNWQLELRNFVHVVPKESVSRLAAPLELKAAE